MRVLAAHARGNGQDLPCHPVDSMMDLAVNLTGHLAARRTIVLAGISG
jgi:hypothetical protein